MWQSRYDEAEANARRALDLSVSMRDQWGQAQHLDLLGSVHTAQGDFPAALTAYERSLALFRELGGRRNEAEVLHHLGTALAAAQRAGDARVHWWRALEIHDDLGLPAAAEVRLRLEPDGSGAGASSADGSSARTSEIP